jgi:hypothetical protein
MKIKPMTASMTFSPEIELVSVDGMGGKEELMLGYGVDMLACNVCGTVSKKRNMMSIIKYDRGIR